jgi:integrase
MKTPRPWFRTQNKTWYICHHGRQIALCQGKENKAEAERLYFQIMARDGGKLPEPAVMTIASVCDLFLDWSHKHHEAKTYQWYKDFLQSFCDRHGKQSVQYVKPYHVTQWLDQHHGWKEGARRCAISCVKRAFNWAESEGILPANPVKKVHKPAANSRDSVLTVAERATILATIKDQPFRDFVFALQETGCRPSEVARVTAQDVVLDANRPDQGQWVLSKHKTKKQTGKPRIVYLTPAMVDLTRRLMAEHPTGPLFRGPRGGKPFTRNSIRCRFRRLRAKLPQLQGVISYTYRHTYATDALEKGVGVIEVAELLGHTDAAMVMKHYQHLSEKREHLRKAAIKAVQPMSA